MEGQRLVIVVVSVIVVVLVVFLWLLPTVERQRLPDLTTAWVGIEAGDGVARVGRVRIDAEQPFRLHAIVEAEGADGERVFYTEASAIRFEESGEEFDGDSLRTWDRPEFARVLWLSLEGAAPYRPLEAGETLDRFQLEDFFHPEWGRSWSIAGSVAARRDDVLELEGESGLGFGTQHYQVWVEISEEEDAAFPDRRIKSPGIEELMADPGSFSAVEAVLPGNLATSSRVFGLSQIEAPSGADAAVLAALEQRYQQGLLFTRRLLLRELLANAGTDLSSLAWNRVDLQARETWGERVGPGDLLRAGSRWVVVFRDGGDQGVVDSGDLCFDFERGAMVRSLSDVFEDTTEGELEWADLAGSDDRTQDGGPSTTP